MRAQRPFAIRASYEEPSAGWSGRADPKDEAQHNGTQWCSISNKLFGPREAHG